MRLKLDLGGIMLHLKIKGCRPTDGENCNYKWCTVDFAVSSGDWLNYHFEDNEVLLSDELESLTEGIEKLLHNELHECVELECAEPNFRFIFHPDFMEWTAAVWSGGRLTDHYLSMRFQRDDLEILLLYLFYVTGKRRASDREIVALVNRDYLTD